MLGPLEGVVDILTVCLSQAYDHKGWESYHLEDDGHTSGH